MSNMTLEELFKNRFCVDIDFNEELSIRVIDLFKQVRELGVQYKISEALTGTWMALEDECEDQYGLGNWGYFGINHSGTYVSDQAWGVTFSAEEFEEIIQTAKSQRSVSSASPLSQANPDKSVIVLGENMVVSGGVVVVNYKSGKKYHLYENGKATFDVANRKVTTERTFTKDGQKAYERVEIDITTLDSIEADSVKLVFQEDNKVAFTTTYIL